MFCITLLLLFVPLPSGCNSVPSVCSSLCLFCGLLSFFVFVHTYLFLIVVLFASCCGHFAAHSHFVTHFVSLRPHSVILCLFLFILASFYVFVVVVYHPLVIVLCLL